MDLLNSRAGQLADFLRDQLSRGELAEPLPNTRAWAQRLGVGCRTLYGALHILERERWIVIRPRQGISILARPEPSSSPPAAKAVRILYRGLDYPEFWVRERWGELFFLLSQSLQPHGIALRVERCTDARLRTICAAPARAGFRELLLLRSCPAPYQRQVARSGLPALIFGHRAPGVDLPYINYDLEGAVRHAVHRLLRRGVQPLYFLVEGGKAHGVERQSAAFRSACESWPHPPAGGEIVPISIRPDSQLDLLRRFAARVRKKCGILVAAPVSSAGVVLALLERRIKVPGDAEMVLIGGKPEAAFVSPTSVRYDISLEAGVKNITRAAVHFFETGAMPEVSKTIAMEISNPLESSR